MTERRLLATVWRPPRALAPWRIEDLFPASQVRYFSFGRRALAAALSAAGVRAGDAVLLPDFICRDLLSSLGAVGARPEYYGVSRRLVPDESPAKWPAAKAVVAVNYFGFPQDLAPFRAYCGQTGAVLIEDNAHGLFSRDLNGDPLGTRGDLGVLSLRKTLPLPNGAALLLPSTDRFPPPAQQPFLPAHGPRGVLKAAARSAAAAAGGRTALTGLRLLRAARGAATGHRLPPPSPEAETTLPLPELPCAELAKPLTLGDPQAEAARRRQLYALVGGALAGNGVETIFPGLPDGTVPYGYPYLADEAGAARAKAALRRLGLEPLGWPDLPDALAGRASAWQKQVRLAHFLW